MIMPKQYLDVFQHYPALRDISDSAYKTHYQNSIARDGMKGNAKIKLALQKQAAGKSKLTTARNTKELKDQLLTHNFKTTYRKV